MMRARPLLWRQAAMAALVAVATASDAERLAAEMHGRVVRFEQLRSF